MVLHEYNALFGVAVCVAFLDGWNIGANDVANSLATSVSSYSLTLPQGMLLASVFELTGAVLAGARVADTVRSKIVKIDLYESQPAVLMLVMVCALIGSSSWLTVATKWGLPVSTTHSIIGGIIGAAVSSVGWRSVNWGWDGPGTAQIFASWVVAPIVAGIFAAIIFTITKYGVLKRDAALTAALIATPLYFGFTTGVLAMLVVWKGAPNLHIDTWSTGQVVGCIIGVALGASTLSATFFVPYMYRRLLMLDWTLRPYHILIGPFLWKRGPVPEPPDQVQMQVVRDYYEGRATKQDLESAQLTASTIEAVQSRKRVLREEESPDSPVDIAELFPDPEKERQKLVEDHWDKQFDWRRVQLVWLLRHKLWPWLVRVVMHGVSKDVVGEQAREGRLARDVRSIHARASHYDNKVEHLYSFLQVFTAACASFSHGSNDVSNAVAPLTATYYIWQHSSVSQTSPVPIWTLLLGGVAIDIGLWTYGYNIMRNLGNRLTLMSPSRGFSMELGSALAIIVATRLALPVSTTQCIVGATTAVGLCNGTWRSINWRMVCWIYFGWVLTLPITATTSGLLMGFFLHIPQWGRSTRTVTGPAPAPPMLF